MCTASRPLFAMLPFAALFAAALAACTPAQVAQGTTDVAVGVKDVICLINVYSTEVQGGTSVAQAVLDAASKCSIAQDIAGTILASHRAGVEREARASMAPKSPDAGH
jgi:hypothetical protein